MAQRQSGQPQGAAASLLNGLTVLEVFSTAEPYLGVTEISERVRLHKSTVSRMLHGFAEAGYLQRDEVSGRYRLGLGLLGLAGPLLADLDVRRAALPHLQDLSRDTSETAAVTLWNRTEAIVVEQVASPHQVKHTATIGTRFNHWGSSSVRLFMAELPDEEVRHLLDSGTIAWSRQDASEQPALNVAEAIDHLARVRYSGCAVNDGQTTRDEFGASAGIRDYRGGLVASVTISAPRSRVHHDGSAEALSRSVIAAAEAVSARLGAYE